MKKRSKKLLLLGAGLAFTSGALAAPATGGFVVQLDKQAVTITPGRDAAHPVASVALGGRVFSVPASGEDMRLSARVRNAYLFVRADHGGHGVRAETNNVFAIRDGALVHLGEIVADTPALTASLARKARAAGRFIDIDDQLEDNGLTGHIDAPNVIVAVAEQNGKFVYDPSWCWPLNLAEYARREADLRDPLEETQEAKAAGFLALVVIDTYCGRTDAGQKDLARARAGLKPEEYERMISVLSQLRIGLRRDQ